MFALPIGFVGGEMLALHIKARQAKLERLESETVDIRARDIG